MSLHLEMCLFTNRSSSSGCIMVLPQLTFVLLWAPFLSPLQCRWRFVVCALWLQCETRVSAELAGAFLALLFVWNVSQHVQRARSETKRRDTPWSSDTPTFKFDARFNNRTFFIFHNGWIDYRYFSCCFPFIMLCNGLKMSKDEVHRLMGFSMSY